MQNRRNRERLLWSILIVAILALSVEIVLLFTEIGRASDEAPEADIVQPLRLDRPLVQGNAMGNPDAPVKIVEYSDFLCGYCRQFYLETEPSLIEEYIATGKVYFVYRTLGDWLGAGSQTSAEAAYCAEDQNKFWEYHDMLFVNQVGGSFSQSRLRVFSQELNLDQGAFDACLSSGKHRGRVQQDAEDGLRVGVRGTPSFLINGKMLAGAQPFTIIRQAIEDALAKTGD